MMHHSKRICLFVNLLLIPAAIVFAQGQMGMQQNATQRIDSLKKLPIRIIPSDYYTKNLGFFCKKELQLEKAIKIPFRFRLGSIEYVDQLEGKGKMKQ